MRIAFLVSSLSTGGAERVAATLCNAWSGDAARGTHEVHLLTYAAADASSAYPFSPAVVRHPLDLFRTSHSTLSRLRNIAARIETVARTLRTIHPDVLLCFMTEANVLGALAARRAGVPVIISERVDPARHPVPRAHRLARRLVYPLADNLVVQNEAVADWYRRWLGANVTIIPNPIDLAIFTPAAKTMPMARRKQIVSVGRLGPQKGTDVLIDAFARIAGRWPDWQLVIYGDGPERGALEARVAALDLRGRISLPGIVNDVAPRLRTASIYATATRYEGFPNAVMEALASGLCVVATEVEGAMATLLGDGAYGLLVPVDSPGALAEALDTAIGDPERRDRLMRAAPRSVAPYAVPCVARRWIDLFESVSSRAGEPDMPGGRT